VSTISARSGDGVLRPVEAPALERERALASVLGSLFGVALEPVQIGRYTLRDRTGSGGGGMVWSAHDALLDRTVAIKQVHAQQGHLTALRREARALARLAHPNVVTPFELLTAHGALFLVMAHVDGVPLREWWQRRPPFTALREVLRQLADALQAAHDAGVVHGDVKPDNVMVGADDRLHLVDFGLASMVEETRCGDVEGGTKGYLAPERLAGGLPSFAADQFAFGVLALEACAHASTPVPRRVRAAFERACATDPKRRHPSMSHVAAMMDRRRSPIAATVAIAVVFGTATWVVDDATPPRCAALADRVAQAVQLAQPVTDGVRGGAEAIAEIRRSAAMWSTAWTNACPAEAPSACLEAQGIRLASTLEAFAGAPRADFAALRIESAIDPTSCVTSMPVASADDPELVRALALWRADRSDEALAVLEARAREPDLEPTAAMAIAWRRGMLMRQLGRTDAARALLEPACLAARELHDDATAIGCALELAYLLAIDEGDLPRAMPWLASARASLATVRGATHLEGELANLDGTIAGMKGDLDDATSHFARAQALFDASGPAWADHAANAVSNRATALWLLGRLGEAREAAVESLARAQRRFGDEHPGIVVELTTLATIDSLAGEFVAARAGFDRALAIADGALGRRHPVTIATRVNAGAALLDMGRHDRARVELASLLDDIGPDDPQYRRTLVNLATAEYALVDFVAARAHAAAASVALGENDRGGRLAQIADALLAALAARAGECATAARHRRAALSQEETLEADDLQRLDDASQRCPI